VFAEVRAEAAMLTIVGYSINDAVIVYDRITEWVDTRFFKGQTGRARALPRTRAKARQDTVV